MKQYASLKFIPLLLLFTLTFGCSISLPKKTYRKSNIVGATINDQSASVEIREELDEQHERILKIAHEAYQTKCREEQRGFFRLS